MKKEKFYFSELEEENAYSIEYLLEEMKEQELTEIDVSLSVRDLKSDYFYCKELNEVCDKPPDGEPCGKLCSDYLPRNGKSGCCKHYGFVYIPGKDFILNINGKLTAKIN